MTFRGLGRRVGTSVGETAQCGQSHMMWPLWSQSGIPILAQLQFTHVGLRTFACPEVPSVRWVHCALTARIVGDKVSSVYGLHGTMV